MRPLWDTRVHFIEAKQCWWWNAWRPSTHTELHGYADTEQDARSAMSRAIKEKEQTLSTLGWRGDGQQPRKPS